jgi:hypothetical protein
MLGILHGNVAGFYLPVLAAELLFLVLARRADGLRRVIALLVRH